MDSTPTDASSAGTSDTPIGTMSWRSSSRLQLHVHNGYDGVGGRERVIGQDQALYLLGAGG